MRVAGVVLIGALLAGCSGVGTTVKYNGGDFVSRKFDEPSIGRTVSAYVGEQLVSKGVIYEQNVLSVITPITGAQYQIPAKQYAQIGYDEKWTFYSPIGVTKMAIADPINAVAVPKGKPGRVCVISPIFGTSTCYDNSSYRVERIGVVGKDSFQQTLLYSGRIGNRISLSYREFKDNMARAAFTHDVEYDLTTSSVIGYKGAQIEVLNADNDSITYRVLRSFR